MTWRQAIIKNMIANGFDETQQRDFIELICSESRVAAMHLDQDIPEEYAMRLAQRMTQAVLESKRAQQNN